MIPSKQTYDDLTAISGIGPARQRWLRESLDVRTYHDLANRSVVQIESRLRAEGQIAARSAIGGWILQARELAVSAASSSTPGAEAEEEPVARKANSPAREDGWKPFASFVVEFQSREVEGEVPERRTSAHYMEKDIGRNWPGIESTKLSQWMLEQIRDTVGLEPEEQGPAHAQPTEPASAKRPPVRIRIDQIRVLQPDSDVLSQTIQAGTPFHGSIVRDKPFTFEVDIELTGPGAADVAKKRIQCTARAYAYDQASGTQIHLGEAGPRPLKQGEQLYTFTLLEASLPQGAYHLWVLVTPQDCTVVLPDFVEVRVFKVI